VKEYFPAFGSDFSTGGFTPGGLYHGILAILLLFGESLFAQFAATTVSGMIALALFTTLVWRWAGIVAAGLFVLLMVSSSVFTAIAFTLWNPAHALPIGLVALYFFYQSAVEGKSVLLPVATGVAAIAAQVHFGYIALVFAFLAVSLFGHHRPSWRVIVAALLAPLVAYAPFLANEATSGWAITRYLAASVESWTNIFPLSTTKYPFLGENWDFLVYPISLAAYFYGVEINLPFGSAIPPAGALTLTGALALLTGVQTGAALLLLTVGRRVPIGLTPYEGRLFWTSLLLQATVLILFVAAGGETSMRHLAPVMAPAALTAALSVIAVFRLAGRYRKRWAAPMIRGFLGLWIAIAILINLATTVYRTPARETRYAFMLHLFEVLAAHREATGLAPRSVAVLREATGGTLSLALYPASYMTLQRGVYQSKGATTVCLALIPDSSANSLPDAGKVMKLLGMGGQATLQGDPVLVQDYAVYTYSAADGNCPESLLNPWEFTAEDLLVLERFGDLPAAGSIPVKEDRGRRFVIRLDDRLPVVGIISLHTTDGQLTATFRSRVLRALLSDGIGTDDRLIKLHRPRLVVELSDGRQAALRFGREILTGEQMTYWPSISSEKLALSGSEPVSAVFKSDGLEILHTRRFGVGLWSPEDQHLLGRVDTGPVLISLFGEAPK